MEKINYRKTNNGERYACKVYDVKRVFRSVDNLSVSFGFLRRYHEFDSRCYKRHNISGMVVTSLHINRRLKVIDSVPILSFYVIKDERYTEEMETIFIERFLPEIYSWYHSILDKSDTSIPGIEELLIEWTRVGFKVHRYRYP